MKHVAIAIAIILAVGLWGSGCLDVADDRAELDRHIGNAEAGEASVTVDDGLANVREFGAGELVLWAQAPELVVHLEPGDQTSWDVRIQNAVPDAQLRLTSPDGQTQIIQPQPTDLPTLRAFILDGLDPQTRYTLTLAPPDSGDLTPWHFAVFADVQDHIYEVQDIYERMAADPELRFCLISGDLTEQGTPEQLTRFERELRELPIPCYATLGNHELGYSESIFRERFGRGNFSFEFRGARFTLLDSASATLAPLVYKWLDGWLDAGQGGLHAVFMHITPLDPAGQRNGAFASRAEGAKFINLLADHDVDMSVYGHIHSYYAYEHAGIPAYISGGGGAIPEKFDGIGRHYLKVEVDPSAQRLSTDVVRID